jgi:hypothetical protein
VVFLVCLYKTVWLLPRLLISCTCQTPKPHLPLRERIRMFWLFYSFMSFNLKCLFYLHRDPDFFQRANSLPLSELAKPAVGLEHTSLLLASNPSLHPPASNLFPMYTQLSHRDLAEICFIRCCSSNRAEQTKKCFSIHNCQWEEPFP